MEGPTLVSMEILLDTDIEHISLSFTGAAFGHLAGALLSGVIYDRLNTELLFVLSMTGK